MTAIVAFILVFGAIVFVHELGHFLAAKAVGVRPFEFAIGFGPALWRRRHGETTYYLRAIPLGGYVRLLGMDPMEEEGSGGDGREQTPESIDDPRSFARKPLWARLFIIASGPLMNFVFAAVLFTVLAATIEIPLTVYRVDPGSPAAEAGIEAGDVLLSVAGEKVDEPRDVNRIVNPRPGVPMQVLLQREGQEMAVTVTPRKLHGSDVALLGVQLSGQPRLSLVEALRAGIAQTWYTTAGIITMLGKMVVRQAPADISGPIGIFQLVGQSARQGVPYVVSLAALLNVNLGLINLLPIPILDGGWLAVFIFEAIRRRPLRPEQRGWAQMVGLVLIVMLMLFATYKDIARLVGL